MVEGWRWVEAQFKMVFKELRGSLPFTVCLNELFMFLCTLSAARWRLNASSVASWWSRSFYAAIHRCMQI